MVVLRNVAALCLAALLATGCSSTTTIYSKPVGARAVIDGERLLGETPIELEEDVWIWTNHMVEISLNGYETRRLQIRSEGLNPGYLVVCVCTAGLLLPMMFVSQYPKQYTVELRPKASTGMNTEPPLLERASIQFE